MLYIDLNYAHVFPLTSFVDRIADVEGDTDEARIEIACCLRYEHSQIDDQEQERNDAGDIWNRFKLCSLHLVLDDYELKIVVRQIDDDGKVIDNAMWNGSSWRYC